MCGYDSKVTGARFSWGSHRHLPVWDYTSGPGMRRGLRAAEGPRHHSAATLSISPTRLPQHTPDTDNEPKSTSVPGSSVKHQVPQKGSVRHKGLQCGV